MLARQISSAVQLALNYLLGVAAGAALLVLVLLLFFTCDLCVLVLAVAAGAAAGVIFCAFLATAGAAIRKGTAATASRVEVISFFIVVSPSTRGGFCFFEACRSQLYCACSRVQTPSRQRVNLNPVFSG
jgi:hypothetical protein